MGRRAGRGIVSRQWRRAPRGVGREAVDPRAGRNRSGMIRTPRVRAPRVVAVRYTPPWPRASQSRGWGAESITHADEVEVERRVTLLRLPQDPGAQLVPAHGGPVHDYGVHHAPRPQGLLHCCGPVGRNAGGLEPAMANDIKTAVGDDGQWFDRRSPPDGQETAEALDLAGGALAAAGPHAGPERRPTAHVRALVSGPEDRHRADPGSRRIAPGLARSLNTWTLAKREEKQS